MQNGELERVKKNEEWSLWSDRKEGYIREMVHEAGECDTDQKT